MAEPQQPLTSRQTRFLEALLTSPTIRKACAKVNVPERTARDWLRHPAFLAAYRAARRATVETVLAGLQASAQRAVRTLRKNLRAAKASDQNKAAALILEHAVKAVQLIDIEERLAALEAAAKAKEENDP